MTPRSAKSVKFEVDYWRVALKNILELNSSILLAKETLDVVPVHLELLTLLLPVTDEGRSMRQEHIDATRRCVEAAIAAMDDQLDIVKGIVAVIHGRGRALEGEPLDETTKGDS